ncbi:MAG: hypothetical protein IPK82_03535 [Polyangiaceae bacterium]|nr:hypothetical protein [Polyangiaceae bacterium]
MNKIHWIKAAVATTLAFAGGFAFFDTTEAQAEQISAISCTVEHHDYPGDYIVNASGIGNLTGNRSRQLHCAVPQSIRTYTGPLYIDSFDGNTSTGTHGQVQARVCMMPWWGAAPDCGAFSRITTNTETGAFSGRALDAIDTTAGKMTRLRGSGFSGHYADLIINVPAHGTFGASQIFGYASW